MTQIYSIGMVFLILLSSTLYYKIKSDHYSAQLESIKVSYQLQQQSIKSAQVQNVKIEKSTQSYVERIHQKPLSENCQKSLQFIVEEMKK